MPPQLPPAPQDPITEGEPRDNTPFLSEEDEITRANQQINQVPVQQDTPETFTQETAQQTTPDFIEAATGLAAPEVFDAAARAQQLQQEQGIASLGEQLNIIDAEIVSYDARVRETARASRERLVPQSLINRELQSIQVASTERRNLLLAERNFLQNQLTSRNNIINSLIQFEQMSYQNALNAYNTAVNRYLQLYELQQNQRIRELDIAQKEREFARAEAQFTMDFIVEAVRRGASIDSIPQGLLDNLRENSIKATGDPNYYQNLANFIVDFNLSTGGSDGDANWKSIQTVQRPDGTFVEVLVDGNTGRTMEVQLGGQPFVRPSTASNTTTLISTNPDTGKVDVHVINEETGEQRIIETGANPKPSQENNPQQDGLRAIIGTDALPTWMTESIASTAANFITADETYKGIPDGAPEKETTALSLYHNWILNSRFNGASADIVPTMFENVVIKTSPDGIRRAEFTTSFTPEERKALGEFTAGYILRNINKYQNKAEFLEDVNARPQFFRDAFARYLEDETFIADTPTGATPQTTQQSTTQQPLEVTENGTITLSNGRDIRVGVSVLKHRDLASQYFPGVPADALGVLGEESGGRIRALNTDGEYSVGLFQINLDVPAWQELVRGEMGNPNATRAQMRDWLYKADNNFRVAAEIYRIANNSFARDWVNASRQLGLS